MSALDWKRCLEQQLEPVLTATDSGAGLSTYTDMPFGIFLYPPEDEWELRQALGVLAVRLENAGKTVQRLSMAQLLQQAIEAAGLTQEEIAEAEQSMGLEIVRDTIRDVLSGKAAGSTPLDQLVADAVDHQAHHQRIFCWSGWGRCLACTAISTAGKPSPQGEPSGGALLPRSARRTRRPAIYG